MFHQLYRFHCVYSMLDNLHRGTVARPARSDFPECHSCWLKIKIHICIVLYIYTYIYIYIYKTYVCTWTLPSLPQIMRAQSFKGYLYVPILLMRFGDITHSSGWSSSLKTPNDIAASQQDRETIRITSIIPYTIKFILLQSTPNSYWLILLADGSEKDYRVVWSISLVESPWSSQPYRVSLIQSACLSQPGGISLIESAWSSQPNRVSLVESACSCHQPWSCVSKYLKK